MAIIFVTKHKKLPQQHGLKDKVCLYAHALGEQGKSCGGRYQLRETKYQEEGKRKNEREGKAEKWRAEIKRARKLKLEINNRRRKGKRQI